jgi:hypothetical protein
MKKYLLIGLQLTLISGNSFASDILFNAISILENDYKLQCSQIDKRSFHCFIKNDRMHGMDISVKENSRNTTLLIEDFNESQIILSSSGLEKGLDRRFFGEGLANSLIKNLDEADADLSCEVLHPYFIGMQQSAVFNPWWQVVSKSECYSSNGLVFKIRANSGSINRSFGFLKTLTITKN